MKSERAENSSLPSGVTTLVPSDVWYPGRDEENPAAGAQEFANGVEEHRGLAHVLDDIGGYAEIVGRATIREHADLPAVHRRGGRELLRWG